MRRLETFKYIITIMVEYEGTSVSGEDLEQELSNSFEGDGGLAFIPTVQQASSTIGTTVRGGGCRNNPHTCADDSTSHPECCSLQHAIFISVQSTIRRTKCSTNFFSKSRSKQETLRFAFIRTIKGAN